MTLEQQLDEARAALHEWQMGRTVKVFVDQNGERIEYSTAGLLRIRQYIAELENKIANRRPTGPMRVFF